MNLKDLFKKNSETSLTRKEKEEIRVRLVAFMRLNKRDHRQVPSFVLFKDFLFAFRKKVRQYALILPHFFSFGSLTKIFKNNQKEYLAMVPQRSTLASNYFSFKKYMIPAVLVVLMLSGGVSFGANSALPGDFLYPVKINVNEKVAGALKVSSEAKAHWNARLAVRRLEEAEKLVAENRFDAKAEAQLATAFENHAKETEKNLADVEGHNNTRVAVEVGADFEAALRAHQTILADLSVKNKKSRDQINLVVNKIENKTAAVAQAKMVAEGKFTAQADGELKVATSGKLKAAENKIAEAKSDLAKAEKIKASANTSATVDVKVDTKLRIAEDAVISGKAHLNAGATAAAFSSFQEAHQAAQEAELLINAEPLINSDASLKTETKSRIKINLGL